MRKGHRVAEGKQIQKILKIADGGGGEEGERV